MKDVGTQWLIGTVISIVYIGFVITVSRFFAGAKLGDDMEKKQ